MVSYKKSFRLKHEDKAIIRYLEDAENESEAIRSLIRKGFDSLNHPVEEKASKEQGHEIEREKKLLSEIAVIKKEVLMIKESIEKLRIPVTEQKAEQAVSAFDQQTEEIQQSAASFLATFGVPTD